MRFINLNIGENKMKKEFLVLILTLLISCQRSPAPSFAVSENYQPPSFTEDSRREKIKAALPELEEIFREHAESMHIPGLAWGIVVDDELVLSSATGTINLEKEIAASPSASFRIASMTKSFTAMAILKLRDEGKIMLGDPAANYLPALEGLQYPTSDSPIITIRHLLSMSAGFPEDNPWGDRQLDETVQMLTDLVEAGISFSNPPSHAYEYSNLGYALLGQVISVVSGKPYQEYISKNILLPLGMEHTYWDYDEAGPGKLALGYRWENESWSTEPMLHDGSFGAMGGMITSIEDFSKYVSFHLSAWPPRSTPDSGLVKRSSLREMHTPNIPKLHADGRDWNGEPCPGISGYGYGLRIDLNCKGIKTISHGGALPGYGSKYYLFPDYGVGLIAFGNLTYTGPLPIDKVSRLLFEELDIQARVLPASLILKQRKEQVARLVQEWDPQLEDEILAENFYLDWSREYRRKESSKMLEQAGAITAIGPIEPENQLRGKFIMHAENGNIEVHFTLTPESDPRVQSLELSFID